MKTNVIKNGFKSALAEAGFQRKGDGWYKETADAVLVVNLQKSNFGEQYHVNLAVWIRQFGDVLFPKEYQCHVRVRASTLDLQKQQYWDHEVFNLDYSGLADEQRIEQVRSFLETVALPFLIRCGSLPELKTLFREGRLKGAAIMGKAQDSLRT